MSHSVQQIEHKNQKNTVKENNKRKDLKKKITDVKAGRQKKHQ